MFAHADAQVANPFVSLKYDSAVIYHYNPSSEGTEIVDKNGRLLTAKVLKSARLDAAAINELNTRLVQNESYGGALKKCFIPHLAVVYYKNGKSVADVLICTTCGGLRSTVMIPANRLGMSDDFKMYLRGLAARYHLY